MTGFRRRGERGLERVLMRNRPEPRPEFLQMLSDTVRRSRGVRRGGSFRLVFAGGLTATMLVALASVGGIGYAASATKRAVTSISRVVQPKGPVVESASSAADQYDKKITICHHTQGRGATKHVTIRISRSALAAHRRHGDTLGPCNSAANQRKHSTKAHKAKWHKRARR